MTDEKLTPERAVRLLRAKAAELETLAASLLPGVDLASSPPTNEQALSTALGYMNADIALIAHLLADHMEHCGVIVRPGDKLVLTTTSSVTHEQADQILQACKGVLPEVEVIVVGGFAATRVAGEGEEDKGYLASILEVTEFDVGSKEEADYVAALKAECDAYLGKRR